MAEIAEIPVENTDHLLTDHDTHSRSPYERGRFALAWRYRSEPTADEMEIFASSSHGLENCLEQFKKGVSAVQKEQTARLAAQMKKDRQ